MTRSPPPACEASPTASSRPAAWSSTRADLGRRPAMSDETEDRAPDVTGSTKGPPDHGHTQTAGPPPPLVSRVLGRPVDERMSRYVDLLATAGVERGLIGPREVGRL